MIIEADPPTDGFTILELSGAVITQKMLAFSIEIDSRGFSGSNETVWFGQRDVDDFLDQLATLERNRQGEAILRTLSDLSEYAPFRFKIYSIDKLGHMAVSAEILQTAYIGITPLSVNNKVSVTFQIDPTSLRRILADFRPLKAQPFVGHAP